MDDENKTSKIWAKEFCDHILEIAKGALTASCLTDENRVELERGIMRLENGLSEITTILDGIDRPSIVEHGFNCLWELMDGIWLIGSRGVVTDSHWNLLVSEPASIKGKKSATNQKPKVDARHAEVLRLMRQVESKTPDISREKLASEVEWLMKDMPLGHSQILKIIRASKT